MAAVRKVFSVKKFLCLLGLIAVFPLFSALSMQMAIDAFQALISGNYPVWPFADISPDPSLIANPVVKAITDLIIGSSCGILIFLLGILAMKMVDEADF